MLWSILWFIFIYETPAVHPRISPEERREIEDAIGTSTSKQRPTYVPWVSILSSPCVWAIIVTHGCSVFGYFTVVNQLPTYMKQILHFNIKEVNISTECTEWCWLNRKGLHDSLLPTLLKIDPLRKYYLSRSLNFSKFIWNILKL